MIFFRYAYTGENRYTAERRLSDGTVEGETVYVRPDGLPVKVHYFADAHGYRPKTEILYAERLAAARAASNVVAAPGVVLSKSFPLTYTLQEPHRGSRI